MPRAFFLVLFVWLAACSLAPQEADQPLLVDPPPLVFSTNTPLLPVLTPTVVPTLQPTCNLSVAPCLFPARAFFQRPIALPANDRVDRIYLFGSTQQGTRIPHHGLEFPNPLGIPVLAVAEGRVMVAGNDHKVTYGDGRDFYGNLVVLEHHLPSVNVPIYTLYAHLSSVEVSVGQTVQAGDMIGKVGLSGAAIGSHLHFEVRLGENAYGQVRNPALWLAPARDENGQPLGALAGRVVDSHGRPLHLFLQVQYFPSRGEPPARTFEVETYAPEKYPVQSDEILQENFVLPDLPPGWYRITPLKGAWQETWVEVASNQVALVLITLK